MSNLAKLSKQAVQHEHDRQFDKALALYARLFDEAGSAAEEVDVALYNRAGDVAMRVGDAGTATRYYERAIDAYAAGGLLNNAIAVCNKVLRYAPDHAATHYTLAVLHAKQGFKGDAKHHFIEYADRMHRAGRDDEALRALTEFAALCPVGDDARTVLAQHLARGNRGTETAVKLQALLDGAAPAAAVASAPERAGAPAAGADDRAADLVFLDVTSDAVSAADAAPTVHVLGLEPTALDAPVPERAPAFELALDDALAATSEASDASDADVPLEPRAAFDGIDGFDAPPADVAMLDLSEPDAFADAPLDFASDAPSMALDLELPLSGPADAVPAADFDAFDAPLEIDAPLALDDVALDDVAAPMAFDTRSEPIALDDPFDDSDAIAIDDAPTLEAALSEAILADAPVELPFMDPDPILETDAAPLEGEQRWGDVLPGELPSLSLRGWLGSASTVIGAAPALQGAAPEPLADAPEPAAGSDFVDLGDWLRAQEPAATTRLLTDESTPTGDEAADFDRLLGIFRAGIARNLEVGDADSHYDLGVAFREMGLIDEAIAEFQKAVQAPGASLRAREALGQCFLDRGSPELAAATLERAVAERGTVGADEARLLNVWYLLGDAHARLGRVAPARECFERVVASDIEFRDAVTRLTQLSASSP